jgi:hypothetical protein
MGLDEIADELYGLPPAEFTAARDQRVGDAKKDGDRELAKAVAALRRPTLGAWLINGVVRARPDLVESLATLGESMRTAQDEFAGEDLRRLSREREALIADLENAARGVADAAGQPVTESMSKDLRSTLVAAIADPEAAASLRAGQLTTALSHSGFGLLGSATVETTQPPPRQSRKKVPAKADVEVDQAELAEAEQAVVAARAEEDAAVGRLARASDVVDQFDQRIATLEEQLAGLHDNRERAAEEVELQIAAHASAGKALVVAEQRLERLREHSVATE